MGSGEEGQIRTLSPKTGLASFSRFQPAAFKEKYQSPKNLQKPGNLMDNLQKEHLDKKSPHLEQFKKLA